MAITSVQSARVLNNAGTGGTVTTSACVAGNLLVATAVFDPNTGAVTPPAGFVQPTGCLFANGTHSATQLWVKVAAGGETSFVFAETGTSQYAVYTVHEFSGVGNFLDGAVAISAAISGVNSFSLTYGSTPAAGELAFAFYVSSATSADSGATGWTQLYAPSTSFDSDGYYWLSTTGSAPSFATTLTGNAGGAGNLMMVVLRFAPVVGGGSLIGPANTGPMVLRRGRQRYRYSTPSSIPLPIQITLTAHGVATTAFAAGVNWRGKMTPSGSATVTMTAKVARSATATATGRATVAFGASVARSAKITPNGAATVTMVAKTALAGKITATGSATVAIAARAAWAAKFTAAGVATVTPAVKVARAATFASNGIATTAMAAKVARAATFSAAGVATVTMVAKVSSMVTFHGVSTTAFVAKVARSATLSSAGLATTTMSAKVARKATFTSNGIATFSAVAKVARTATFIAHGGPTTAIFTAKVARAATFISTGVATTTWAAPVSRKATLISHGVATVLFTGQTGSRFTANGVGHLTLGAVRNLLKFSPIGQATFTPSGKLALKPTWVTHGVSTVVMLLVPPVLPSPGIFLTTIGRATALKMSITPITNVMTIAAILDKHSMSITPVTKIQITLAVLDAHTEMIGPPSAKLILIGGIGH